MDKAKRNPHALYCDDLSLVQQCFKDECDVNLIVARAMKSGELLHTNTRVAQYGDFSNVPDYQSALNLVSRATAMFMSLNADARERFANDPGRMVVFLQDPSNYDEALKLGLVNKRPEKAVSGDSSAANAVGGQGAGAKPATGTTNV